MYLCIIRLLRGQVLEPLQKVIVSLLKSVQEKDELSAFQSPVRGDVIMAETGLEAGPKIGALKKMIEEAILDGRIPNEFDAALEYLREIKDKVIDSKLSESFYDINGYQFVSNGFKDYEEIKKTTALCYRKFYMRFKFLVKPFLYPKLMLRFLKGVGLFYHVINEKRMAS